MKIKQNPADFRVEELTDVTAGGTGDFSLYRLDKTGWTTLDAIAAIRRRWQIDANRVNYGGLKDRHADTTQYLSILRGPARDLTHERIRLKYLGRIASPYESQNISANRFTITVRHLAKELASEAMKTARVVEQTGWPNYFDDQRFGSVTRDGRFVAREMVAGRFEEALKLALAASYEFDRAPQKAEKQILLDHWGRWPECKAALPKSHARSLVDYLVSHPTDFKGAVERLKAELQGMYMAAYQSHIWNRTLDRWIRDEFPDSARIEVRLRMGNHAVPNAAIEGATQRFNELSLPLPSARLKPAGDEIWLPALQATLVEEGLTLAGMKVPGAKSRFFSKGERAACVRPTGMSCEEGVDELNKGKRKAIFRFDLPRGCYATMFIKRITT